jgi:siroheme synthase-like protein
MLPIFVKLDGRRAVVVGGGPIAARKTNELLDVGAVVVAVSPSFSDAFPVHARVQRIERPFAAGDTRGAAIVFSCTGEPQVDDEVSRDAQQHGTLVNVVDKPDLSTFYSAATVRRGPVVVAVGTSGASPTLARKVRDKIDEMLPAGIAQLGESLGRARPRLLARYPRMDERARVVEAFVERAWWRFFAGPVRADVARDIETAVESELLGGPDEERACT